MGYNIVRCTTIRLVVAYYSFMIHVIVSICKSNLFDYIYLINSKLLCISLNEKGYDMKYDMTAAESSMIK